MNTEEGKSDISPEKLKIFFKKATTNQKSSGEKNRNSFCMHHAYAQVGRSLQEIKPGLNDFSKETWGV